MLISSPIPNLVNGVSQQPPTLRLASQAEEQVNFRSSVADGLVVRPPSRHLAVLDDAEWSDAFIHTINRDVNERYIVVIRNNAIRVFEAKTGVERVVNAPKGFGYLEGASKGDFKATSVADYTFILNGTKTVQINPTLTPDRVNQAMVFIRAGNYGKTYKISLGGVEAASFKTPDGGAASQAPQIDTNFIAEQLFDGLQAWQAGPDAPTDASQYVFERLGDIIVIRRTDAEKIVASVEDGSGGTNTTYVYENIQRFSDLPPRAPEGFAVEISGDQSSSFDNYYVQFNDDVWKEVARGGETFKMNATTLPHILVREADGTFTFSRATWDGREVGDLNKVPHPSFAGRKIRDVFFYQNRLGFVSDENVIMSQNGRFFKFYRSTATSTLDTDPIDVAVSSSQVSILNHAVPFNKSLLLFSDQSQFVLEGGAQLSPDNVGVSQATAFESIRSVRPVGVGQYVYFPVPRGNNAAIREYYVQEGNEQNDALDVTAHVPRYLPLSLSKLVASSSEDILLALADDSPNKIFVYSFFFSREGKLQSAWSTWDFSPEDVIHNVEFIESTLYLVVSRGSATFIDKIDLESGSTDLDSSLTFRVDRGVYSENCPSVFDGENTTFTLPYETGEELFAVVRGGNQNTREGVIVSNTRGSPSTVTLRGDWRTTNLVIGQKFTATYVFSAFHIRDVDGGGSSKANTAGRLQIRYLSVDYANSYHFRLSSTPRGRARVLKEFSGRILGTLSGEVGTLLPSNGRFRIPVMCRNIDASIEIICDTPLPASFTSAEWEAQYTTRSRKV